MSNPKHGRRTAIPEDVEVEVLGKSLRRCCLCCYLDGVHTPQQGQIAHVDRDPSNNRIENLAFLCLRHHDEYDSRRSQSKGFKPAELIHYRELLYTSTEEHTAHIEDTISRAQHTPVTSNVDPLDALAHDKWRLQGPWQSRWRIGDGPALFAYKSPNGFDGICRVEAIGLNNGQIAVICEQVIDNPGMSITNAVEFLAFQICQSYRIDPERLILIEHYEQKLFGDEDPWLWVHFEKRPPEGFFEGPSWHEIDDLDWRNFGIKPKTRRRPRESLIRRLF